MPDLVGMVCPKLEATEEKVDALRGTMAALRCTIEELQAVVASLKQQLEKGAETHTELGRKCR